MSKQVSVYTQCDYPGCSSTSVNDGSPELEEESRSVHPLEFLVYSRGRGRRSEPIVVDMCDKHIAELKDLYKAMARFDQNKAR